MRGTGLFLLSPLDWALIESWKNAEVPLEAVLRGIDQAFITWRSRRYKSQMINSLAFCVQAVLTEAQAMARSATRSARKTAAPPFSIRELSAYLDGNARAVREKYPEIAARLERLSAEVETHYSDLEELEQRLTVLEEKMIGAARNAQSEEELLDRRRELDRQLRPHRAKMTAAQLAMLEKQYLERRLLEKAGLPRLSLFYLR